MLVDFEVAAINSFSEIFPNTSISGCFYYLSDIIIKYMENNQEVGLQEQNNNDPEFTALAFIFPGDVVNTFERLYEVILNTSGIAQYWITLRTHIWEGFAEMLRVAYRYSLYICGICSTVPIRRCHEPTITKRDVVLEFRTLHFGSLFSYFDKNTRLIVWGYFRLLEAILLLSKCGDTLIVAKEF